MTLSTQWSLLHFKHLEIYFKNVNARSQQACLYLLPIKCVSVGLEFLDLLAAKGFVVIGFLVCPVFRIGMTFQLAFFTGLFLCCVLVGSLDFFSLNLFVVRLDRMIGVFDFDLRWLKYVVLFVFW